MIAQNFYCLLRGSEPQSVFIQITEEMEGGLLWYFSLKLFD